MKKYVIIVAGGSGMRMGGEIPKQFLQIGSTPILMHTINKFFTFDAQISIILVLPRNEIDYWNSLCGKYNFKIEHQVVSGGNSRFQSVKNGLKTIENEGIVAIHDGVRPFVPIQTIANSFVVAEQKGNAIASVKLKDSIRFANEENETVSIDRSKCYLIQTPQTFQIPLIKKAFEVEESESFTDDATVLEAMGEKINLIDGSYQNIKITTPDDLVFAEAIVAKTL